MKRDNILVLLFISIVTIGCHSKPIIQSSNSKVETEEVSIDPKADLLDKGASYKIDSMFINSDVLSIIVKYGGGCDKHNFELISNGMYSNSLPPKLNLCLKHYNHDDLCKKLIVKELSFNIGKLKYKGKNTVILHIGDKKINYNY